MSKYFIASLITCLLLIPMIGEAQPVFTIKGIVKDAGNGDPIKDANIVQGRTGTRTDRQGRFSLRTDSRDSILISSMAHRRVVLPVSTDSSTIIINMEPVIDPLQDVVVSGSMRAVTKLASPIPVEVFSAKFFKKNPTPNIFEALSIVNGVQPQLNCNVCNTGDIHINGMDGPYTAVLIDGMPIVSSLSTVYGLSGIPNSMVKRIEIVKGPASTLYGSEAVGGLINVITKDPLTASRFAADMNITHLGELNVDLSTDLGKDKSRTLIGMNIYNYRTSHDINHDNFTDVTQQSRLSLFSKMDIYRKNDLPASVAIRMFAEERWGGELQWTRRWRGSDSIYGESIDTRRAELIGRYGLSRSLMLEYSYNFHLQDSYYGTTAFFAKQHTAFSQLRWSRSVGRHQLLAGLPYRLLWYDDNTAATARANGNKPILQKTIALFLQDDIKLSDRLSALIGTRYEHSNVQGSVVSPRLAIMWRPDPQQTLRFSSGNGFRIVNLFTEDHAALSGFREIVIRNELKPERSWNANVNYMIESKVGSGLLSLDASLFYTYFTNKILPDYLTDPQKIIYDNLKGHAVSTGCSINADLVMSNGMKWMAGLTLMDVYTKNEETGMRKEQQQFAPRFTMNYAFSLPVKAWDLNIDLTGKCYGPMRLPIVPNDFRPEYSPFFQLMNVQMTKRLKKGWEVYCSIKNLLNFIPKDPILRPFDPFDRTVNDPVNNPNGYTFDPSYSYAPMQGIKAMIGVRMEVR